MHGFWISIAQNVVGPIWAVFADKRERGNSVNSLYLKNYKTSFLAHLCVKAALL